MQESPSLVALCRAALRQGPSRLAVEFEGSRFLWSDFRQLADQLASSFLASDLGRQTTVAFVARNRPSALAAFLGLLSMHCTVRMVSPFQSAAALASELDRIDASVVVAAEEDFADAVLAVVRARQMLAIGLVEMAARALPGLERAGNRQADSSGQPSVVLLTSGTTGPPKPFSLSYETIARHFAGNMAMAPGGKVDTTAPALLYFPISNVSGLYATLPPLLNGVPIVLLDRFSLDGWLRFVRRHRPKVSGLPPAAYRQVLSADVPVEDLASIEYFGAGAAPLDVNVQRAFETHYGIPILLSYGATEFAGPVCSMTPALWQQWGREKLGSVGRPLPGMQLRVVDPESGEEVGPGAEGLLEVISCRIGPDWIRTADLGVIDADGFLFLRGRADGAIIRGGFKILPATIESALLRHIAVREAAVVAVADARLGQVPGAAVAVEEAAEDLTVAALEAHLRCLLPATHIPKHWRFIQALPRTVSMKVDMGAVRQLFDAPTDA